MRLLRKGLGTKSSAHQPRGGWPAVVSQPDVLCVGGEENVWSLSHTFCDLSEYITSIYLRGQNGVPSMSVMSFGAEA